MFGGAERMEPERNGSPMPLLSALAGVMLSASLGFPSSLDDVAAERAPIRQRRASVGYPHPGK